jgi:hypothetical protein
MKGIVEMKQNGSRTGFEPVLLVVLSLSILSLLIFPARSGHITAIGRMAARLGLVLAEWLGTLISLGNTFVIWLSSLVIRLAASIYHHYRVRLTKLSTRQKLLSAGLNLAGLAVLVSLTHPQSGSKHRKERDR